ncbi:MAG TPA: hypothetical protein VMR81_06145 [Patescibacteria group bacterium]|nr:hypothetical protein [Patescibacteria group bacterium]
MIEDARHAGMSLENQMEIKAADPREKGYNEWRLPFKERMSELLVEMLQNPQFAGVATVLGALIESSG